MKSRALLVIVITISLSVGAQALTPLPETPTPEAFSLAVLEDAEALAQRIATADPVGALRALTAEAGLEERGVAVPSLRLAEAMTQLAALDGFPLGADARADLALRIAALPAGLEDELARVLSALVAAHALRASALAELADQDIAFLLDHMPVAFAPGEAGWAFASTAGESPVRPTAEDAAVRERVATLAAGVDAADLAAGAALVLQASMDSLPGLRSVASRMDVPAEPLSHGCDIFEEAPYVCVRGTGNDEWHRDWWLAVDLGGDDLYLNNQGATRGTAIPVAALIDVDGRDRFEAPVLVSQALAQGAASLGVGVLVSGGGLNTYEAVAAFTPPPLTPAPPAATVIAQGAATLGAGVLVDLGASSFDAHASTLGQAASVTAQGAARLGGVGLLFAAGTADTPYRATSDSDFLLTSQTPTSSTWSAGPASTVAQGAGEGGAGLLVDLGGDDLYSALAHGSTATTTAQGAAELGAGILVDVGGADTRTAHAIVDAQLVANHVVTCPAGFICNMSAHVSVNMGGARTSAQGAGGAGAGLLAALAGADDVNAVVAESVPVAGVWIIFGGGGGSAGSFHADSHVVAGPVDIRAHGSGATGAGIFLATGLGSDLYSMSASSAPHAHASTSGGASNTAFASAVGGDARPRGQGFGSFGAGILKDAAGDDAYRVTAAATATAIQNGAPGSATPGVVSFGGRALAEDAAAVGLLLDLGGRDEYGGVPSGLFPGDNDTCWSNSPPGLPDAVDTRIAMGIDAEAPFASLLAAPCSPVPPN